MSKLIVEVCKVDKVDKHPGADRLGIALVKGWKTIVKYDPETGKADFEEGQKCVFFPPDSILPSPLIERLNIRKYLHQLPKNEKGERPDSGRVVATRLRGEPSYGVIMHLDPNQGDNPEWEIGVDVSEHFGITKYEPPVKFQGGEAEVPHPRFYRYTDIENFANFPEAIPEGTEVVYTEKIHGMNCRCGLVLDEDNSGKPAWKYMAGSHDVQRKQLYRTENRYRVSDLIEFDVIKTTPKVGEVFFHNGRNWQIDEINWQIDEIKYKPINGFFKKILSRWLPIIFLSEAEKLQVFEVKKSVSGWETHYNHSEFWLPLSDPKIKLGIQTLMEYVRDMDWSEPKYSIMLYGELYGSGSGQDMHYGIENGYGFRTFDISVNNKYLDFNLKKKLCDTFDVEMVPVLYLGPFNLQSLQEFTSGPTTLCAPENAGHFKGREGVVVVPVVEVNNCPVLNGRRIVKSISADYHARKDETEFH